MQQTMSPADLARAYNLRRASELPPNPKPRDPALEPPRLEYVDETPKRARRTEHEAIAEESLGHYWVTILAYDRVMPARIGDNNGTFPVWVEGNADWRTSGVTADRYSPVARPVRLMVLGVRSAAHGLRLKTELDEALLGRQQEEGSAELRKRFTNGIDFGEPVHWLTPLLQDALMRCGLEASDFEVFTRQEHAAMVKRAHDKMFG